MNNTGIHPVEFKVLVEQQEVEKVSDGGILLTNETTEKEQWKVSVCKVLALGSRAFFDCPQDKPEVGDWILMREYSGFRVQGKDGGEYHLINDKDVMAGYDHE